MLHGRQRTRINCSLDVVYSYWVDPFEADELVCGPSETGIRLPLPLSLTLLVDVLFVALRESLDLQQQFLLLSPGLLVQVVLVRTHGQGQPVSVVLQGRGDLELIYRV